VDIRRRQRADLVPARLLTFDPRDWTTSPGEPRWLLWQRWKDARARWAEEHGESTALGGALARLKYEMHVILPGSARRMREDDHER
jgi:hypothetical protein